MRALKHYLYGYLVGALVLPAAWPATADAQTLQDRMFHHRAIEAVVWGMPLLNYKGWRDGVAEAGVRPNDVGYFSQLQDWRYQTATPNNTTPYVVFYWTVEDGPMVIEIPPSTTDVGVFGTLMDSWQRPLDDVGAAGRDKGLGAKYLIVPEAYDGPLLPGAFVYTQRTHQGWGALRAIMPDASEESLSKASEFVRGIKIYPLSRADNEPETAYVDLYDKLLEMTPVLDGSVYAELHEILQEEVVEEQNLAMMGMLARIGLRRDLPFEPDAKAQAIFDAAAPEALKYMIEQYHRAYNPPVYEGKKWSTLLPAGAIETEFSYEYPSYFDYDPRGAVYYAIITSVKNYGSATFYLDLAEDADGEWLHGGNNYKLTMPANIQVRDFWAISAYDLETASYVREVSRSSVDSDQAELQYNRDGTVDIYFGPTAPEGNESNWLPTDPNRRFFLLARFYGPEPSLFDDAFELNNIEKLD